MKPGEKAIDLIKKYAPYCTYNAEGLVFPVAKKCALIAVDEVLNCDAIFHGKDAHTINERLYWEQVKTEINKL